MRLAPEEAEEPEFARLLEALGGGMADRGRLFVFPSQAVADAWAAAALERLGLEVVESERFIGWDRFKERCLSARRRERPADRLARTIWAAGVVARQAESPFLRRIAGLTPKGGQARTPVGGQATAFVPFLSSLPPSLNRITRVLDGPAGRALLARDEGLSDLAELKRDYAAFLAAHGLFEPGWEAVQAAAAEGESYLIVAPELMEDFAEYRAGLEGLGPRVELLPLERAAAAPPLLRFDNAYEELRYAFLKVGELLDSGLHPEEIALTLPALELAAPYVERAAALAGVPCVVRSGEALSASPYGRLLAELSAAASGGFDFEPLRALLLDRFAAWKDEGAARGLLRFGIERHAYASYAEGGRRVDIWEESFDRSGAGEGALRGFYRRLKRSLLALGAARDFGALRSAIFAFRRDFLDESGWGEEETRRVEVAMDELSGLAKAEEELGAAGSLPSPLSLYLSFLSTSTYVPQRKGAAVSVYPYRVSALLPARRHLVLGASQDAIRVSYSALSFLREDQKEALGLADREATEDFAAAYAGSGATFSYSVEGWEGFAIPHPLFAPGPAEPPDFASLREADPLRAEAAAWRGEAELPGRLPSFQARAFESALPSLRAGRPGFLELAASAEAREAALARARRKDGLLRLSATHVEEYLACPFAWLLGRGLRLEEEPTGPSFFDARLAGEIAHAALRALLSSMGELGPLSRERLPAYRRLVEPSIEAVLPGFEEREGPFLKPMFEAYRPLLSDRLGRLAAALSEEPGWESGELEAGFEKAYPERGFVLEGRMDRLGRRPEPALPGGYAHAIVDYKKNRLPTKAELRVDGEGKLGDYQIAAYVVLAEEAGRPVELASYWSIEGASELRVLGPGGLKAREDYGAELEAFDRALGATAAGLEAGRFEAAGPNSPSCSGCPWKAICRLHYAAK